VAQAEKDAQNWREMYYNQREEIGGIKAAKEDLVHKNRELFGQLNG
jgi:hypothetical protein